MENLTFLAMRLFPIAILAIIIKVNVYNVRVITDIILLETIELNVEMI